MSIQKTNPSPAALQDQSASLNRPKSSSSSTQSSSFEALMDGATPAPAPVELTALQKLFRSLPSDAASQNQQPVSLIGPAVYTSAAEPFPEQDDAMGPTPAAPWPTMKMNLHTQPELGGIAKQAIRGALQQAGMDPSRVRMAYWEELVGYPGGSYINRNVTVEASNGRKIDLDAAYMARCPWLAAEVIQTLESGRDV